MARATPDGTGRSPEPPLFRHPVLTVRSCKPGCAWKENLAWSTNAKGSPKVCDAGNNPVWDGLNTQSGCASGNGYLCDLYSPTPVTEELSYGFAILNGAHNCCKCFQLTWRNGAAAGKQMIVQSINGFDLTGDLKSNDIVILSPGGGHGPNEAGCKKQYGRTWWVLLLSRMPMVHFTDTGSKQGSEQWRRGQPV